MPLVTEARNTPQSAASEVQPSVSTQMTETAPCEAAAVFAAPAPAPPATGKMMSAPWLTKSSETDLPLLESVKDWLNEPPFWLASSQPRTWTLVPLAWL